MRSVSNMIFFIQKMPTKTLALQIKTALCTLRDQVRSQNTTSIFTIIVNWSHVGHLPLTTSVLMNISWKLLLNVGSANFLPRIIEKRNIQGEVQLNNQLSAYVVHLTPWKTFFDFFVYIPYHYNKMNQ